MWRRIVWGVRRFLYQTRIIPFSVFLMLVFGGIFCYHYFSNQVVAPQANLAKDLQLIAVNGQETVVGAMREWIPRDNSTPKAILSRGIPLLRERPDLQENINNKEHRDFLRSLVYSSTNVDLGDLRTFLSSQIPLLAALPVQDNLIAHNVAPVTANPESETPNSQEDSSERPNPLYQDNQVNEKLPGQPLVAIYHTHTAESYLPWQGVTHVNGGKRGNIVDVGNMLVKSLEEEKIKVVHSLAVHDYPTFRESYRRSYVTANQLVEKYPSLKMVVDLHRDAGVKEKTVAEVNGKRAARILIDIGTDRLGLPHPNWQKNFELGKLVEKRMNEMYPGLCRGVITANARYNQHVSPGAILLEIGDQYSTREEARESAYLCGKVLAKVLAEIQ